MIYKRQKDLDERMYSPDGIAFDVQKEYKKASLLCICGSRDTYYTGFGGYMESDPSRNMPMIEGDEIFCKKCNRVFFD